MKIFPLVASGYAPQFRYFDRSCNMKIGKNRNRFAGSERRAFTLIEVIVVIIIIGVLATLVVPRLMGRVGQAKQGAAASNAANLANQFQLMLTDLGGSIPSGVTIDALLECPAGVNKTDWKGPYVRNKDELLDPWGNKFKVVMPGQKNTADFDVVSYGEDGQPGGEGKNADIVKP
jgi:general secretion pathway protein G